MKQDLINITLALGYKAKGFGFIKQSETTTHWITVFDDTSVQLYAYANDDINEEIYNTQVITIQVTELQTLIKIFLRSHI